MPIWWIAFVGISCLVAGFIFNVDGLKLAGVVVMIPSALGLLVGLFRRRT